MRKEKFLIVASLSVILLIGLSACSNSSNNATSDHNQSTLEKVSESTSDSSQSNDYSSSDRTKSNNSSNIHSDEAADEEPSNSDKNTVTGTRNENTREDNTISTATKIEGKRNEFIEKLGSIQTELDALPEKEASDKGVTNAMKSYYGIAYEKYDKALNEIYALLQKELSIETMKELKTEQIKWIKQKEDAAHEEREKYEGGTHENVAYYISAYESTKVRCYELVSKYMTD